MPRPTPLASFFAVVGVTLALFAAPNATPPAEAGVRKGWKYTVYTPKKWNGTTVFLSVACHDGNDGVPGGPCRPNIGCRGFNENATSAVIARWATKGNKEHPGLLGRGYKVIVGTGTVMQNIRTSNRLGANYHIPIHSNAKREGCSNTYFRGHGTWGMYYSSRGKSCAKNLVRTVGAVSPGTRDQIMPRRDLAELKRTRAVSCYLETDFHTWNRGVNFLTSSYSWGWRIGYAMDLTTGRRR